MIFSFFCEFGKNWGRIYKSCENGNEGGFRRCSKRRACGAGNSAHCGNIARTCAATGSRLHLVRPLGFDIGEAAVRRAGLDYWHLVDISVYDGLDDFFRRSGASDLWLATTKAPRPYTEACFRDGCWLLFGKETAGLPQELRTRYRDRCLRLPMRGEARSLNLAKFVRSS